MRGINSGEGLVFVKQSKIDSTIEDIFSYHLHSGSLNRLIPPWSIFRVLQESDQLKNESLAILQLKIGPIKIKWIFQHKAISKTFNFKTR